MSEALKQRLRADLKAAMRTRDTTATTVLRAVIAAIDNAQAVPVDLSGPASAMRSFGDSAGEVARIMLGEDDLRILLAREAAEREEASVEMLRLGRPTDAERLADEAAIVRRYL